MGIKGRGQILFYSHNLMAKLIQVVNELGGQPVATFQTTLPVKAGAVSSILPGYPVIVDGSNAGYCKAAPDNMTTSDVFLGIANSTSTDTVAVDGTVTIEAAPVMVVAIKAKTPGSLTAAMKLTNKYTIDLTSSNYTLDQGTTTNGVLKLITFDNITDGNCLATIDTNW